MTRKPRYIILSIRMTQNKKLYIELVPELDACVETQARRQYNQTLSQLLKKDENKELEEKLETLKLFLESADFNKLRSESEKHPIAGRKVKFTLHLENDKPIYEMTIIGEV